MSTWHDYVQSTGSLPPWPYPINYGKVNEVATDVLVVGGGVAGCRAAIAAARAGVKVAIAERGHPKRSGAGGAGVDHWHGAVTNPCSKVTPEMYTSACYESMRGYTGPTSAISSPGKAGTRYSNASRWGCRYGMSVMSSRGRPFVTRRPS